MKNKDSIVGLRLYPEDAQKLGKWSHEFGTSQSRLIRLALRFCSTMDDKGRVVLRSDFRRFVERDLATPLFGA